VKRLTSYWLKPFQFSALDRASIEKLLKHGSSDVFVQAIAEECAHYAEGVKADVPRKKIIEWRGEIERIGATGAAAASAMRSLDEDCARLLDMGFVLETHRLDSRKTALNQLDELARVCTRVAAFGEFNPKEGAPVDLDRRLLARRCAEAYSKATQKGAKTSPNGTFARVLLIVMHAVRAIPQAQTSISQEFLKSVVSPDTIPER
jgi:hypothetical protein